MRYGSRLHAVGMPSNRKQRGEVVNTDSPNWGPLEALVGRDLAPEFMWMYEIELRNRTRLHAYKHHLTRRYVYVARDGRCYGFEDEDSYRQITQHQAIYGAFDLWADLRSDHHVIHHLTPREQAALEFVREYASWEILEAGEETVLLAGPGRFDPLYRTYGWESDHPDDESLTEDADVPF